ncbi:unnamed protein product [Cyclocybe aegerita]|uniref:Uncharacterized protein n=1 Tax=Cyclocybe aegerita TaxID=1973307 RepID=A0A8S0WLR1_CYCAE|nr:unnamed protein product [Cyclocybe aegerita]
MHNLHEVADTASGVGYHCIYEPQWSEDPTMSPPLSVESPKKASKSSAPTKKLPQKKLKRPSKVTDDFISVLGAVILYMFTNSGEVTTLIRWAVPQCLALPRSRLPLICMGPALKESDTLASILRISLGPSKTIPLLPSSAGLSQKEVLHHWTILVLVVVSYAWGFYNVILVFSRTWTSLCRKSENSALVIDSQSRVSNVTGSFHESEIAHSSSIADVEILLEAALESKSSFKHVIDPAIANAFDLSPNAQAPIQEPTDVDVSLNISGENTPCGDEASSEQLSGEGQAKVVDVDERLVIEGLVESNSEKEVSEMVVQVPTSPPKLNPEAPPFVPQIMDMPPLSASASADDSLDSEVDDAPETSPVTAKRSVRRCCSRCPRWYQCTDRK